MPEFTKIFKKNKKKAVNKESEIEYSMTPRHGHGCDVFDEQGIRQVAGCLPIDPINKRFLLVSSSGNPGAWVIPKGGWEKDETQKQAAMRETWEEAGVKGVITRHIGVFAEKTKTGVKAHHWIYEMEIKEVTKNFPEQKKRERRWFTYDEAMLVVKANYIHDALSMSSLSPLAHPELVSTTEKKKKKDKKKKKKKEREDEAEMGSDTEKEKTKETKDDKSDVDASSDEENKEKKKKKKDKKKKEKKKKEKENSEEGEREPLVDETVIPQNEEHKNNEKVVDETRNFLPPIQVNHSNLLPQSNMQPQRIHNNPPDMQPQRIHNNPPDMQPQRIHNNPSDMQPQRIHNNPSNTQPQRIPNNPSNFYRPIPQQRPQPTQFSPSQYQQSRPQFHPQQYLQQQRPAPQHYFQQQQQQQQQRPNPGQFPPSHYHKQHLPPASQPNPPMYPNYQPYKTNN